MKALTGTANRKQRPAEICTENFATPGQQTTSVCNLHYLEQVTRGNTKAIHEIVAVFFKETKQELSFLNQAIKKSNYPVIGHISHKIKSAFLILGISALEPVFKEMEQLSSSTASISNIKLLNQRVNLIFKQAKAEMKLVS